MEPASSSFWRKVGAPTRFARTRMDRVARRPVWWTCWTVVWVLVFWDIYLALDGAPGNTWSEVTREASSSSPLLPWVLGGLLGHLFHHRDDLSPVGGEDGGPVLMAVLTVTVGLAGWLGLRLDGWLFTSVAMAGLCAGYLFMPKARRGEWKW